MGPLAVRIRAEVDVERACQAARALAKECDMDAVAQECVVLATAELGSNLLRYAQDGDLQVMRIDGPRRGILVVSEDTGPGIPDLVAARVDGFSTGGGLGGGLGAVERLMDETEMRSGATGTTITARKWSD